MKKIFGLFMLYMTFVLTSCEQPEGPDSLIGHWEMVGNHWIADFKNNGEMYLSSTEYDTGILYLYSATSDSLWIEHATLSSVKYPCIYYFENKNTLVIDGFAALTPRHDLVTDSIRSKVRTKWIRAKCSK